MMPLISVRLLALAFVTLFQLTICSATQRETGKHEKLPETFDYDAFMKKYSKSYDQLESLSRAKLFYARTLSIFKANILYATNKMGHYLHQNQYTDLTPKEVKTFLTSNNAGLKPVKEAQISPDTPADEFENFAGSALMDGMSQSSLGDLLHDNPSQVTKPIIDFFSPSNEYLTSKALIREIANHSDLAQEMSRVIEFKDNEEKTATDYKANLKANSIIFKPYIKPTNKKFDPSLIPSKSAAVSFGDSHSNMMLEDFLGILEPYPTAVRPKKKVLGYVDYDDDDDDEDEDDDSPSAVSEFFSSIKSFRNYFRESKSSIELESDELGKEDKKVDKKPDSQEKPTEKRHKISMYDIDWRKTGCISRPKSQSKCNSCYAFTTLDLFEFFYCRQTKTSTEFSVQYVVDCGGRAKLSGCQGGRLSNVGIFIKKYGLQLNSIYPYVGFEQQCPFLDEHADKSYIMKPRITGWQMFTEMSAWYQWLPKSPIIVGINMPSDFLAYGGGIHEGKDCTPGMVHALLLVGSGKQDGKPFWLLKNSFSDTWGEDGYFRLSKKAPIKCFDSAIVARVKFSA